MNLIQLTSTKDALRQSLREYERINPACNTCLNLQAGICTHYQQQPPDEWKRGPVDCAAWEYDNVPF